jgi:hypothetical protein
MKPGAAETAPLLQRDETLISKPKPGAIAAAVRQAKRGVGVFGVALALSGVLVAIMAGAPDAGTKKRAARVLKLTLVVATPLHKTRARPQALRPPDGRDHAGDERRRREVRAEHVGPRFFH